MRSVFVAFALASSGVSFLTGCGFGFGFGGGGVDFGFGAGGGARFAGGLFGFVGFGLLSTLPIEPAREEALAFAYSSSSS